MHCGAVLSTARAAARAAVGALAAVTSIGLVSSAAHGQVSDPFVDQVIAFTPGTSAGFGAQGLPGVVLGPPRGGGETFGSLDVLALGNDGSIVLVFDEPICDGPGPDFTVFENAFHAGSAQGPIFAEVGIVSVSSNGVDFFEFPYDPDTLEGLAGRAPVFSHPDNGIDPTDPSVSGGDPFDLRDIGIAEALYIRIVDPGASIEDPGNRVPPGTSGGFDLDAIAAVNPCEGSETTTTTSTTSTSSTTTTMAKAVCGDGSLDFGEECDAGTAAVGSGCSPLCKLVTCGDADANTLLTAVDALFALRASVGTVECATCVCDVDGVGTVTAVDALRILRVAVGILGSAFSCPACQ